MSPSETEVLRILWQLGMGTVRDFCNRLPSRRQIAYATVHTFLRRLDAKGYITHKTKGKAHVFIPAVRREDVIKRAVRDFVDRLFGGDPVLLMLHLADRTKFQEEDIRRLKGSICGNA